MKTLIPLTITGLLLSSPAHAISLVGLHTGGSCGIMASTPSEIGITIAGAVALGALVFWRVARRRSKV